MSYLDGSALSTVSGLMLTSSNYDEAVRLLEDRYGNTQVEITAHMEALLKIKRVKKMDGVSLLRKLCNDVENCVRNLKALGILTSTYGSLLVPILNDRFPDELRVIISRKFGNDPWTLEETIVYLNEEILTYERCGAFRNVNIDAEAEKQEQMQKRTSTTYVYHVRLPRQICMRRVIEMILKNACIAGKKELKIDVLIGQNFYYSLISNTVIRGKSGPVALKSTFFDSWRRRHKSKWESIQLHRYACAIGQLSKR